jgi:microcystin degradation protein MlrC
MPGTDSPNDDAAPNDDVRPNVDARPLVLVGGFKHELNSFAQGTFSLEDIARAGYYAEGPEIFDAPDHARPELAAIRHAAAAEGLRLIPTVTFWAANAGGPIEHSVYERAKSLLVDAAGEHRDELAGIMLPLHGATVTTEEDDPEGDLLATLREIVGPDVPIVATFDTHVHGTARMARNADALVGFKTHPHVDHYETAQHAMRILVGAMRGEVRPVTTHRKLRMLTSAERQNLTIDGAYRRLIAISREMERRPGVLAVSIFTTQPWMDLPEVGWSIEVVTDNDPDLGAAVADELGRLCWDARDAFLVPRVPIAEALDRAAAATERPIILADGSDSTTAGGSGDGNELLAAILARPDSIEALLTVTDPAAVDVCNRAGIGATVEVDLGGAFTPEFAPIRVRGRVLALALGEMQLDPPWASTDVGRVALLRVGSVDVVLTERRPWHLDSVIYRHVGRDVRRYQVVQVKSAGGYRAHYAPIAAEIIEIQTDGPCNSDLTRLPFKRIPRPMWPFDPDLATPWLEGETVTTTDRAAS